MCPISLNFLFLHLHLLNVMVESDFGNGQF